MPRMSKGSLKSVTQGGEVPWKVEVLLKEMCCLHFTDVGERNLIPPVGHLEPEVVPGLSHLLHCRRQHNWDWGWAFRMGPGSWLPWPSHPAAHPAGNTSERKPHNNLKPHFAPLQKHEGTQIFAAFRRLIWICVFIVFHLGKEMKFLYSQLPSLQSLKSNTSWFPDFLLVTKDPEAHFSLTVRALETCCGSDRDPFRKPDQSAAVYFPQNSF